MAGGEPKTNICPNGQTDLRIGRRKLSKRGEPEARRLLYLAALAASRKPGSYRELLEHYINEGYSKIEATVFVARKLARTAWSIYKHNTAYMPSRVRNQLQEAGIVDSDVIIIKELQEVGVPLRTLHTSEQAEPVFSKIMGCST